MTRQATPRLASPPVRPPAAPSKSDSRLDRRDLSSVYREIAVQYCVDSPDHAWIHHSLVNEHEQQSLATPRSCLAKMPSTKPSIVLRSGSSSMETSTNNSSAATATKRCPRNKPVGDHLHHLVSKLHVFRAPGVGAERRSADPAERSRRRPKQDEVPRRPVFAHEESSR